MSDIFFVNYASGVFTKYQNINNIFISIFVRPKKIFSYTKENLLIEDKDFLTKNKKTFDEPRGDGYWLWKPYVILNALRKIPNNSYLIYYDCGVGLRYRVFTGCKEFIRWIENNNQSFIPGIYIPEHGSHIKWCKPSVLNRELNSLELNTQLPQMQATFSIWKKNDISQNFLQKWLEKCQIDGAIDDSENENDVLYRDNYIEHRHDQAILSCLCIQEHVKTINEHDEFLLYNKSLSFVELQLKGKRSCIAWCAVKIIKFVNKLRK
jgi:hypothetical protein